MSEEMYLKLAKVLDTLPNGFPKTESGVEIKLLKRIFRPEDAELFCDLRLSFETAQQISERTGRQLGGLEDHLVEMGQRGQIFGVNIGGMMVFKTHYCQEWQEVFCHAISLKRKNQTKRICDPWSTHGIDDCGIW